MTQRVPDSEPDEIALFLFECFFVFWISLCVICMPHYLFLFSSELKRRLKAEKKAQEKAAKAASQPADSAKPAAAKKVQRDLCFIFLD